MQIIRKASVFFIFTIALATFQLWTSEASAQSTYFTSRGCAGCHASPVVASCNGCHYHGNRSLKAATNKTSYAPGEAVTVTLTSTSTRAGWIRATLFNENSVQIAESTGNASGMGSSTTFPAALSAPAPTTPGTYTWKMAYYGNSANTGSTHGAVTVNTNSFTVATTVVPAKIGIFSNGKWFLDVSNDGAWNSATTDRQPFLGFQGAIPVTGDWNGSGTTGLGVYDKGTWYIDLNNNGVWEGIPADSNYLFGNGIAGALPVTGDWTGTGTTKIGVYTKGTWYLDLNGNKTWDSTPGDGLYTFGEGLTNAVPVSGDWSGDGITKIGVYADGIWYLDYNNNKTWDGPVNDRQYYFGFNGALPVTGDWNADGKTEIGAFNDGTWYLDLNGNGAWNGTPTDTNRFFGIGVTGAVPVAGKW